MKYHFRGVLIQEGGAYSGGEPFIWENTVFFFTYVIYCSIQIHQNTLPKFSVFFLPKITGVFTGK